MSETPQERAAVALRYEADEDSAPRVTAAGLARMAEGIIRLARENGIPLHSDPELVALLSCLDLEEAIPPEAYQVVAEILAFVYSLNEHRLKADS